MEQQIELLQRRTACELDPTHLPHRGGLQEMQLSSDKFLQYRDVRNQLKSWKVFFESNLKNDPSNVGPILLANWSAAIEAANALRESLADDLEAAFDNQKIRSEREINELEAKFKEDSAALNDVIDQIRAVKDESAEMESMVELLLDMKDYADKATLFVNVTSAIKIGRNPDAIGEIAAAATGKLLPSESFSHEKIVEALTGPPDSKIKIIADKLAEQRMQEILFYANRKTGAASLGKLYQRVRDDVAGIHAARTKLAEAEDGVVQAENIREHCQESADLADHVDGADGPPLDPAPVVSPVPPPQHTHATPVDTSGDGAPDMTLSPEFAPGPGETPVEPGRDGGPAAVDTDDDGQPDMTLSADYDPDPDEPPQQATDEATPEEAEDGEEEVCAPDDDEPNVSAQEDEEADQISLPDDDEPNVGDNADDADHEDGHAPTEAPQAVPG